MTKWCAAIAASLCFLSLSAVSADPGTGAAVPAAAPDPAAKDRARALLAEGNQRLDEGRYLDALDLFQRAYDAFPSPKLHFNIAQTLNELGRVVEALHHYELFLRDVPKAEMPEQWALANERAFQIQGRIASVVLQSNVVDAGVTLDGVPVGSTPIADPIRVLPGTHSLIVGKPGFEQQVIELTLAAGETETARVTLLTTAAAIAQRAEFQRAEAERRAAESRLRRAQSEARQRREQRRRILRISGWTSLGVGVAASLAAGTFGALHWYETSELESAPDGWTWEKDAKPHYDRAQAYRVMSIGAAVTAAVGLAVGTGLVLSSRPDARDARERTSLVPTLGRDTAGVALTGRF